MTLEVTASAGAAEAARLMEETGRAAKLALWDAFCADHGASASSTPLFDTTDGASVRSAPYGKDGRLVLRRSPAMDALVIAEVEKVLGDYAAGTGEYDGLIYMMFWPDAGSGRLLPLYIGKSEKFGRGGGNLSANIAGIRTNGGKFCRWGYNYAYHMGDLSAVACSGHAPERVSDKYRRWASRLFEECPSETPQLVRPVRFWLKAWRSGDVGIWREWGATSLTFLEYLLIGVASDLFPETLLNNEGVNRS